MLFLILKFLGIHLFHQCIQQFIHTEYQIFNQNINTKITQSFHKNYVILQ